MGRSICTSPGLRSLAGSRSFAPAIPRPAAQPGTRFLQPATRCQNQVFAGRSTCTGKGAWGFLLRIQRSLGIGRFGLSRLPTWSRRRSRTTPEYRRGTVHSAFARRTLRPCCAVPNSLEGFRAYHPDRFSLSRRSRRLVTASGREARFVLSGRPRLTRRAGPSRGLPTSDDSAYPYPRRHSQILNRQIMSPISPRSDRSVKNGVVVSARLSLSAFA